MVWCCYYGYREEEGVVTMVTGRRRVLLLW